MSDHHEYRKASTVASDSSQEPVSFDQYKRVDRSVTNALRARSWRTVTVLEELPADDARRKIWNALLFPLLIPEDRLYIAARQLA